MNITTLSFITKLSRLHSQINAALLADYAYKAGELALKILKARTLAAITRVKDSEDLSESIRNSILRSANLLIMRATHIVGIIIRSTSVRNGFELYVPFLEICKSLLGSDASLILSSEWQYVPFTFPQNLQELPNFVIIGLPASESDNALIFPAAGHELGHSIWLKNNYRKQSRALFERNIDEIVLKRRQTIEQTFPQIAGADLDQDIFVQYIKSSIYNNSIAQAEEFFSDFIGLILFGESYLYAFEFLIAPQLNGTRSTEYPETLHRAKILQNFAEENMGIKIPNYTKVFISDQKITLHQSQMILDLADEVTEAILPYLFDQAAAAIEAAGVRAPNSESTKKVELAFIEKVPYDGNDASIGDIINAAWRIYRADASAHMGNAERRLEECLTDLVMKTVELIELRRYMP